MGAYKEQTSVALFGLLGTQKFLLSPHNCKIILPPPPRLQLHRHNGSPGNHPQRKPSESEAEPRHQLAPVLTINHFAAYTYSNLGMPNTLSFLGILKKCYFGSEASSFAVRTHMNS